MVFLHPHHDSMACPATLNLTNDGVVVGEGEGGEVVDGGLMDECL